MIQEYLFIDDTHRNAVEKYTPDKASCEIYDIDNSACWIVTYSFPGENEDCAKALSQINRETLPTPSCHHTDQIITKKQQK